MILVTGATGNVGGEVVRALLGAGEAVRGLTRAARASTTGDGVELWPGDLDRPETLAAALGGVRALFLLDGYRDMRGILDQARRAGVQRVVLLSSGSTVGGDMDNAIARFHMEAEA